MPNSPFHPFSISPMDEYNRELLQQIHPPDWVNPQPANCYDLVVIGGGTAGLVVAVGAAGLDIGLKVALVERNLMGGDCLNTGCVPSKSLIRSSRVVGEMWNASNYGIASPESIDVDFSAVMERLRKIRAGMSHHDSVHRVAKVGVDIFLGQGSFIGNQAIQVDEVTLNYKKAVIATGARAVHPQTPGLADAGYLTNETVFNLTERPKRLAVIGGGPIGCELAQAFRRLGSQVTLIHRHGHILHREDADAAEIVQQRFIQEGIELVLGGEPERVEKTAAGNVLTLHHQGQSKQVLVDEILIGAGRTPNLDGLNLEAAGVAYHRRGVKVNEYLQTTNPNIYAAGDICMDWKFTHGADAAARIVIQNALFAPFGLGRPKLSSLVMPWVTYTEPEVAHVGLYEREANEKGIETKTIKIEFKDVDRAIADGETEGFLKVLHEKSSDKILGATMVSRHAGESISEITTAMVGGLGLKTLARVIHPYPTQAECIRKAADVYKRTQLTPTSKKLLKLLHRFT
ncbi:mercuric reductase [Phormidium yuhuli AB48]|uniref:Mercuric reductase n=1 Tax=Phormidium yuhuli AB48 TaxID=2940671 RepID=A0ABY5AQ44_9CYAN|nr:mercuric reductase [Phormidium yuhuli]USR91335.1 mercuric reductase [Phormidium yuhuli AB48]